MNEAEYANWKQKFQRLSMESHEAMIDAIDGEIARTKKNKKVAKAVMIAGAILSLLALMGHMSDKEFVAIFWVFVGPLAFVIGLLLIMKGTSSNTLEEFKKVYIKNEIQEVQKMSTTKSLITEDIKLSGWLMDTLICVNEIQSDEFTLSDMYKFEQELAEKHPNNKNIQAKIREQLQLLRDKGFIESIERGKYKKVYK